MKDNSENTVSLVEVFWEILRHWVMLLIFVLVFAAGFAGYKYMSDKKAEDAQIQANAKVQKLIDDNLATEKDVIKPVPYASIQPKNVVIGAVLGIVGDCVLVLLMFIFSGKIKGISEFEDKYYAPLYGPILQGKKSCFQNFIDRRMYKVRSIKNSDELCDYYLSRVVSDIKQFDVKELIICEDGNKAECFDGLLKRLEDAGVKYNKVTDILGNAKDFETFDEKSAVLFFKQARKSSRKILDEEVKLCDRKKKRILGFVIAG